MIGGQTKSRHDVLFERKVDYIGGAAIVAKHLAASGGRVTFSTVLVIDELKDFASTICVGRHRGACDRRPLAADGQQERNRGRRYRC